MGNREFITDRIKVSEDTQIARLSIAEQIKLLISHFSPSDGERIKAQRAVVKEETTKHIQCRRLLDMLDDRMRQESRTRIVATVKSSLYYEFTQEIEARRSIYNYKLGEITAPIELNYDISLVVTRKEVDADGEEKE